MRLSMVAWLLSAQGVEVPKVTSDRRVFISYVRDDLTRVNMLDDRLRAAGIPTWLDKRDLHPGQRWKKEIRSAIRQGGAFIACFSAASETREISFMRTELVAAVNQLILHPMDRSWFFPVKLSPCELPEIEIGFGEFLADIQWVDLFTDFEIGIQQLISRLGISLGVQVTPNIEGWRRFNWIPFGPVSESRVARDERGVWTVAAPERTYNGLFGISAVRTCRYRLSLEFLIEQPQLVSAGYGIGVSPYAQFDKDTPSGWCLEIGWHGRARQFKISDTYLPDGPWQGTDTEGFALDSLVVPGAWIPLEIFIRESHTEVVLRGRRFDFHPAAQHGSPLFRVWGSTVKLRNIDFG
jgi:hypothetical protein